MGGGAWPFLVRGLICQVNSVNGRDFDLLIGEIYCIVLCIRRTICVQHEEARSNNRSVMPLDVLGSTRATLMHIMCVVFLDDGVTINMHQPRDYFLECYISTRNP